MHSCKSFFFALEARLWQKSLSVHNIAIFSAHTAHIALIIQILSMANPIGGGHSPGPLMSD